MFYKKPVQHTVKLPLLLLRHIFFFSPQKCEGRQHEETLATCNLHEPCIQNEEVWVLAQARTQTNIKTRTDTPMHSKYTQNQQSSRYRLHRMLGQSAASEHLRPARHTEQVGLASITLWRHFSLMLTQQKTKIPRIALDCLDKYTN